MIVVLDTNVFFHDVYAQGQGLTTLYRACGDGQVEGIEMWTPRGVVEELVRQYPERLRKLKKDLKKAGVATSAFRLPAPEVPSFDEAAVAEYRKQLEQRLVGPRRKIADHPVDVSRVIDWAAQRRHPIKVSDPPQPSKAAEEGMMEPQDGSQKAIKGVVDAAIWLTVIDAARADEVALVTANTSDFADPADNSKLHPLLIADLEADGRDPTRVTRYDRVTDFNERFVAPVQAAQDAAAAFLADEVLAGVLKTDIEDAVGWYPISQPENEWGVQVEIDELTVAEFNAKGPPRLVRADPAEQGFYMTVEISGEARVDLAIRKSLIADVDEAPVTVIDYDWNESMMLAEAYVGAHVVAEVRVTVLGASAERPEDEYDLSVSVEEILPA
jgi:hypothetical protein